ncbi:MAG: hypothetical protein JKX97_00505 [Candidatus Lindowbacteria bacterium]|nr:hypothetical protein [Candidatus Lindowbacteria bacterium]
MADGVVTRKSNFLTMSDSPFMCQVSTSRLRMAFQAALLVTAQCFIVFGVRTTRWFEAYDTTWFHLHYAALIVEFATAMTCTNVKDGNAYVISLHIHVLQVLALIVIYSSGLLFALAVRDVIDVSDSGEFRERLGIVSAVLLLDMWRLGSYAFAIESNVSRFHSPNTASGVFICSNGLAAFPSDSPPITVKDDQKVGRFVAGAAGKAGVVHRAAPQCPSCKNEAAGYQVQPISSHTPFIRRALCERHASAE